MWFELVLLFDFKIVLLRKVCEFFGNNFGVFFYVLYVWIIVSISYFGLLVKC